MTNPDGTEQDFAYDAQGRLSESSINNGSEAVQYTYAVGGTVAVTNPQGGTTTYYYDENGLLAKFIDPLGRTTDQGESAL